MLRVAGVWLCWDPVRAMHCGFGAGMPLSACSVFVCVCRCAALQGGPLLFAQHHLSCLQNTLYVLMHQVRT